MAAIFEINAQPRQEIGKANARRIRQAGKLIPGIVYGADEPPQSLYLNRNEIVKSLENEGIASHILTLKIADKVQKVVLREVQRRPGRDELLHLDFFRISEKEKIVMTVPIHFLNEEKCPGLKAGGVVSHIFNELEVRCLPADLPEYIEVDVGNLELNGSIHLSQVVLPKGVELMALVQGGDEAHDQAIVNVHLPRQIEEPEATAAPSAEVPTVAETEEKKAAAEAPPEKSKP